MTGRPRGERGDGAEVLATDAQPEGPMQEGELEPDVERIHRPILREPPDPEEGREPAPWWLWTLAALALFWGGWYLGQHGGAFGTETHTAFPGAAPETALADDPIVAGEAVYLRSCQACHQASGLGAAGAFPPLIGSDWVTGPPETVVRIVLDGLQGPITVAGETYQGVMPAWRDLLSDDEIAAVATFVRQWDTNEAGAVEPELVAELRAATEARAGSAWTAEELQAAPTDVAADTAAGAADAAGDTATGSGNAAADTTGNESDAPRGEPAGGPRP